MRRLRVPSLLLVVAALLVLPAGASAAPNADLRTTMSASPDPGDAGAQITYTISVTNLASSNSSASNVSLTDNLPSGETLVSWSQTAGPGFTLSSTSTSASAAAPVLGPGMSATFRLVAQIDPASTAPTLSNSASASSATADSNSSNNTAGASTGVSTHADLRTTVDPAATTVGAGGSVLYKMPTLNQGPSLARNVSETFVAPAGTSVVGANAPAGGSLSTNGQVVTFTFPNLAPGASGTPSVTLQTNASTPDPTLIDSTATVTSGTPDPDTSNNSSTARVGVGTKADLSVGVTDSPDPVERGATLTYSVSLANNGVDASDVTLTDAVPAGTTFVSAAQTGGAQAFDLAQPPVGAAGDVTFSLGRLNAGGSATFQIVVKVTDSAAGGTVVHDTATAATSTAETSTDNNSASTASTVASHPAPPPPPGTVVDLRTTAGAKTKAVKHGRNVRVRFKVTNRGNKEATGARLTGRLPSRLKLLSAVSNGGQCARRKKIDCDLGDIAPGKSRTVTVVVKITRKGRFSMRARANCAQTDAHPTNNTASVALRGR